MERFEVTAEWRGSRLDRFVRSQLPGTPFGVIQILLRKGLIYLNGERAGGRARLEEGDVVSIDVIDASGPGPAKKPGAETPPRKRAAAARRAAPPEAARRAVSSRGAPVIGTDIPILHEDDDILVVDKPAGIVVQPGNRKERGSLLDSLEEYRRRSAGSRRRRRAAATDRAAAGGQPFPYTPVHRLDRETSGVLVAAKTRPAARSLSRSFAMGAVRKVYLAVVEGAPEERERTIDSPLATEKTAKSRSRPSIEGKPALTHYSMIRRLPGGRALLQVVIETGRTHQIRAHLASIGHPVVGDREYGAAPGGREARLLLHAWTIYFPHPTTGDMLLLTAEPPEDMRIDQGGFDG